MPNDYRQLSVRTDVVTRFSTLHNMARLTTGQKITISDLLAALVQMGEKDPNALRETLKTLLETPVSA